MDITDLRFKFTRFLATMFALAMGYIAYLIAGGNLMKFWRPIIGLGIFIVAAVLVVFVIWGIVQRKHVWVSVIAAILLVATTVALTNLAPSAGVWFLHLFSWRGFFAAVALTSGIVVGSLTHKPSRTSPSAPSGRSPHAAASQAGFGG